MKLQATPVHGAVACLLLGLAGSALAQSTPQPALDTVVVTGIRASQEKSLNLKRKAETHVEVITAEDIGKMPDKNIADSLQRVPGVTISSAGASEGGFDENDRVSMRGTNASLTQTLINGHVVSSGDWFVLNQVVVRKTAEASLVEGGLTGAVDIITRKPLDFTKQLTAEASLGAVYADLPGKTDPQLSALINWRSNDKSFGVLAQVFSEKRHLRRDGVEVLGYNQIQPGSAVALSNPDLSGVYYPAAQPRRLGLADRLHVDAQRQQLQPQLPDARALLPQRGRGLGTRRRLCGAQQHPGVGQLRRQGRQLRPVRHDFAPWREGQDRVRQPGRQVQRQ